MHIEPGVVDGAKILLSYGTSAVALGMTTKVAVDHVRNRGLLSLAGKSILASILVLSFFEVLPHHPVGVSEVHFILGSTLFLLFGLAPAAIGLASGLLAQGLLLAPFDLPQYGVNTTTLLVPLFAMSVLARRIIPSDTAYKDIKYSQALRLSLTFQGGIIAWVAFWALYGQGVGAANLAQVAAFSGAYLSVIIVEPLIDLAVLAGAKTWHSLRGSKLLEVRLYNSAIETPKG